jgi:ABC-2 type transport system ATP-binding protein
MPAVKTRNLTKTYVSVRKEPGLKGSIRSLLRPQRVEVHAVRGVDLTIEQGELVGFLGPNGAGKTTTLKMLSGILYPTSGEAEVLGYVPFKRDPRMLRQIALLMGNKQQLWWDLPAWDSFLVLKELYEVDDAHFKRRVENLVESLQLTDKVNTQVRKLSLGERMKCELVASLLHAPRVVFLDEPTLGLDVVSQKRIREFLREVHREDGCTILLTSHYMQDVQELCDRVVVIDHGTVVYEGTLQALAAKFSDTRRVRLTFSSPVLESDLSRYGRVLGEVGDTGVIEIARVDTPSVTAAVLGSLPVVDVAIEDVDVEDVIRDLFMKGR